MHFLDKEQKSSNIEEGESNYKNNGLQIRLKKIEKLYIYVEGLYSRMNIKDAHKYDLRQTCKNLQERKAGKLTHLDLDVIMNECTFINNELT